MRSRALLAALALAGLTACGKAPEEAAIDHNAALLQASLENQADALEAIANTATDPEAAAAIDHAADRLEAEKHDIAHAAHAAKAELKR